MEDQSVPILSCTVAQHWTMQSLYSGKSHTSVLVWHCFCAWNFQLFCNSSSSYPFFFFKRFNSLGCYQAPKHVIINLTKTSYTSAIKLSLPAPLKNDTISQHSDVYYIKMSWILEVSVPKCHISIYLLCLSLAVHFAIDTLLSVCCCECNTITVWNFLSECVELEEDFFCILSIGDVLYFFNGF